ncbi:MAG TPA: cardiolipin synthase [Bacteriovoracaceae bacterium]|nr:cardiolipin synthase [Bacteriovoracaceae bacterium]
MFIQIVVHLLGLYLAINALFQSRTPQGATAWFLGLVGFPYLAIPLFIAFGRRRYHEESPEPHCDLPYAEMVEHKTDSLKEFEKFLNHTGSGFTGSNTIGLLVDGESIYHSMLQEIAVAREYIILQVFIFRTDETGKMFAEALKKKALEGVKIYFLYEKVLIKMSPDVIKDMLNAGIKIGLFKPFKRNKWHLNFRNHRKILVVDGRVGFIGGLNIGDDYVGKYPQIGPWRDTNVKICGPALIPAQRAFAKDWLSSQGYECDVEWKIVPCMGEANVVLFSSGPVEEKPLSLLHHIALVDLATKKLWIANPYIVPPQSLMDALAMAALRGVDVRILVPQKNDNPFIVAVDDIYYERLMGYGVRIFKFQAGFMHQKVMLIDDILGVVGSANLDFRSMYINFEVTAASSDPAFITDLEKMLRADFSHSRELSIEEIKKSPTWKKVWQRGVNLLAPVL